MAAMGSAGVSLAGTSSNQDGGSSPNPAPSFICTGVAAYARGCVFCMREAAGHPGALGSGIQVVLVGVH